MPLEQIYPRGGVENQGFSVDSSSRAAKVSEPRQNT